MSDRRTFIRHSSALTAMSLLAATPLKHFAGSPKELKMNDKNFWPHDTRLVISVSMQFEAGGQPEYGADSPFPNNMQKGFPDLPAQTWFQYGYKEGIPRLLDLWDEFGIKVTSHMVGQAVMNNPTLAKEIVQRGHEAAAHGMSWSSQYNLSYEDEKKFISDGVQAVKQVTGQTPAGYNANWLRRGQNTLRILQELGFLYHIDDLSRDEPFIIPVNGKDFAVVPYTLRNNDIQLVEGRYFSSADFELQLKNEFDQLYLEAGKRRRMMSVSTHDRIGGTPGMVQALRNFLKYAQQHSGVAFMRKDEIARFALNSKQTIRE
ncbi:polysaccharide deacetylase family protein [Chitinophagaceae bacterium MMS25-I14]